MVVGALIVAHRPSNAIGWIFSAIGLLAFTALLAVEYATYAYVTRPGSLPGATLAAWYSSWPWYPAIALALILTPLLFPTGRLLSSRWRPVAWLAGVATAGLMVLGALGPELDLARDHAIANPIGVAWAENPEESTVVPTLSVLLVVSGLAAAGSLVLRFRRSRGEERQQLKWFTYAVALLPLFVLADFLPGSGGSLLSAVPLVLLPVAVGIAILRYRLYDIDRLINRTLVYGLLTALLAGVYAGTVLVLGQVFGRGWEGPAELGCGRGDPGGGGAIPAGSPSHSGGCRSALQPPQVRCRQDGRGVQRPHAGRGRPGRALGRAASRGRADNPADPGLAVAPASAPGSAAWSLVGKLTRLRHALTPCMPCSFSAAGSPRSGAVSQLRGPIRLTVIDRQIPLVTAACGT
jgi:hypothetical protein